MTPRKLRTYKNPTAAANAAENAEIDDALFHGDSLRLAEALPSDSVDLVFSSPPYCMGKSYETTNSVKDFVDFHERLIPNLLRITKPGGSICWQVGYHSDGKRITPLDFLAHNIFSKHAELFLRNRVVWTFAHGLHAKKRFSGRHETVLWYTKGKDGAFDLDSVRVPQKYPGKRSYRGPNRGDFSGNPLGKNPGDVWNIPNVKGYHVEKTVHPCQFPVALLLPFIRALVPVNGLIFDPFMGVGSTGVAAAIEGRRFLGGEILKEYVVVAKQRITNARKGRTKYRPLEQPIYEPKATASVAKKPEHFRG